MKNIFLVIILQLYILCNVQAQINELGFTIGNNFSSHTNSDPTIPEDGQFQWTNLNSLNVGIYSAMNLSEKWNIKSTINFQQKGYTEFAQTGLLGGPLQTINDNILRNRLSYITLSVFGDFILNPKNDNISLSAFFGLENNFLIGRTLESEMVPIIADFYPVNEYQDNWNGYHLNYNFGFRTTVNKSLGISAFYSRSISPVLKTERLIVKDWIWGLSLDLNLLEIFKENN